MRPLHVDAYTKRALACAIRLVGRSTRGPSACVGFRAVADRALSEPLPLRRPLSSKTSRPAPQRRRRGGASVSADSASCDPSVGSIHASDDRFGVEKSDPLVARRTGVSAGSGPSWTNADDRLPADIAGGLTGLSARIAREMPSGGSGHIWRFGSPRSCASCADREPRSAQRHRVLYRIPVRASINHMNRCPISSSLCTSPRDWLRARTSCSGAQPHSRPLAAALVPH